MQCGVVCIVWLVICSGNCVLTHGVVCSAELCFITRGGMQCGIVCFLWFGGSMQCGVLCFVIRSGIQCGIVCFVVRSGTRWYAVFFAVC